MTANSEKIGEINVTPLIDILLVLLIIFMVITPLASHGLDASLPQNASSSLNNQPEPQIVLEMTQDHRYLLNGREIQSENLAAEVGGIYQARINQQIFIKADQEMEYREVAQTIDNLRGASRGLQFGILTAK